MQTAGGTPPESHVFTAFSTQPERSAPRTLCPTPGVIRSRPCGKRAATSAAVAAGVRRSRSPASTSTGTFGSGPLPIPGRAEYAGQRRHMKAGPICAAHLPNGPVPLAGSAARAAS